MTTTNHTNPPQETAMNQTDFTTSFTVEQTPEDVFAAINNVRGWWSGDIDGDTATLDGEFSYRYQDEHRSTQRITESIPGRRVVWHVLDGYLSFVEDKTEWTGTDIIFDIDRKGDQTEVRFRHVGLLSESECFDSCSTAWAFYINTSLRSLITSGKGQPNE